MEIVRVGCALSTRRWNSDERLHPICTGLFVENISPEQLLPLHVCMICKLHYLKIDCVENIMRTMNENMINSWTPT